MTTLAVHADVCGDKDTTPARPKSFAGGGTSDQLALGRDASLAVAAAGGVLETLKLSGDWPSSAGLLTAPAPCRIPRAVTGFTPSSQPAACKGRSSQQQVVDGMSTVSSANGSCLNFLSSDQGPRQLSQHDECCLSACSCHSFALLTVFTAFGLQRTHLICMP